jgi:hypothetical protein
MYLNTKNSDAVCLLYTRGDEHTKIRGDELISAFIKDVTSGGHTSGDGSRRSWENINILTSIDCDFGQGDAWPNFVSVEVMDPVPIFVGDVDRIRRHTIGAGLTPLGQPPARRGTRTANDVDRDRSTKNSSSSTTTKMNALMFVLRAGLPESLLHKLGEGRVLSPGGDENAMGDDRNTRSDDPWQIAARRGFHPVFDAGVKRLIMVVYGGGLGRTTERGVTCRRPGCGMHQRHVT